MKTFIVVRTQFEAIHNWPACPFKSVDFLTHPHRHIFYTEVKWEVSHSDRDKEFIIQKRILIEYLRKNYEKDLGSMSCEMIAEDILSHLEADYVSVFEDNENGAEVYK